MAGISKSKLRNVISWYFTWRIPILVILLGVGAVLLLAGLILFKHQISNGSLSRSRLVPAVSTERFMEDSSEQISETILQPPSKILPLTNQELEQASYEVQPGDTLWDIAEAQFGDPLLWPLLYESNSSTIGTNPNLILPGQVLLL